MAEKVEVIEIDAGNSAKTLKELKEEIKNLRKELDNCEIGSNEFVSTLDKLTDAQKELKDATKTTNEALEGSYDALVAKMAELKKAWKATADEAERASLGEQISSINDQLKEMDASIGNYQRNVGNYASAFDGVSIQIEGFTGATRSMIGSLDLVEGGLKSMGIESEATGEILDKMKGLMVLTNGLNSVKEGVAVFKTLKTATNTATIAQNGLNASMAANPIGAVVAIVMTLITALTALFSWLNKVNDSTESLKKQNDELTESIKRQNEELDYNIQLMAAKGASELDQLEYQLKEQIKITNETAAVYKKLREEALDSKRWGGFAKSISEEEQEQIDAAMEKWKEEYAKYEEIQRKITIVTTREATKRAEEEAAASEERKKRWKEEADKRIEEERRAIKEIDDLYKKQKLERANYWLNDLQLQMKQLDEWAKHEKEVVRNQRKNGLISEQEYLDQIFEIDKIFWDNEAKIKADAAEASEKYFEDGTIAFVEAEKAKQDAVEETKEKVTWATMEMSDKMNAMAGLAGTAFGQTAQLLNTLAQTQDQTSEKGFKAYKKLATSAAIMSTLQGIISAWTSAMSLPAPISFITGGLMTAATATLGGIQIDQIKKQAFNGGDSSLSTSTSMPNINTAALMSNPINYTTEVRGAKVEEEIANTRVYVVESDITDTVNKVKVTQDESTY